MKAFISYSSDKAFSGVVDNMPGDKSISHRSLMLSALAEGETVIHGLLTGEDVKMTAAALRAMSAEIIEPEDISAPWRVVGRGIEGLSSPHHALYMGNSGTSARLLMGMMGRYDLSAQITGDSSLQKRPMGRVMKPLMAMGVGFEMTGGGEHLPLIVKGRAVLSPLDYTLPVASAQVKSALLLAALGAAGQTIIKEPIATRDHTENMLKAFGVVLDIQPFQAGSEIKLEGGQSLRSPSVIHVPKDPSSAAFLIAAALLRDSSDLILSSICINKARIGFIQTVIEMGAQIEFLNKRVEAGEEIADVRIKSSALKGVHVPAVRAASMIDEYPILTVLAMTADGTTRMDGLAELKVKESNRFMKCVELAMLENIPVRYGDDWLELEGRGSQLQGGFTVKTELDHRIAMSALVMGLISKAPVMIDDGQAIETSFPDFVPLMNRLGAEILAL